MINVSKISKQYVSLQLLLSGRLCFSNTHFLYYVITFQKTREKKMKFHSLF